MRKIKDSEDAVVGIFVAILLIGLVITIFSMVQTQYLPQWLEQREYDHMHEVSYQFSQIKHSLDILSIIQEKNALSMYITLGMSDMPFFDKGRTYDSIEILQNSCNVEVSNGIDTYSFPISTIQYESGNSYYVNQLYIYEAGVLLLSQSNQSLLQGKQFLTISNFTEIYFTIVDISSFDGKRSAYGYGTYSLYSEFLDSDSYTVENVTSINITTNHKNAWYHFFNSTSLKYSGLTYEIKKHDDGVTVEFTAPLGDLYLKVVDISVQIAPGWVE